MTHIEQIAGLPMGTPLAGFEVIADPGMPDDTTLIGYRDPDGHLIPIAKIKHAPAGTIVGDLRPRKALVVVSHEVLDASEESGT